jgi:hypothetical protein
MRLSLLQILAYVSFLTFIEKLVYIFLTSTHNERFVLLGRNKNQLQIRYARVI